MSAATAVLLDSFEPMKVARTLVGAHFTTPQSTMGLRWWRESFWVWNKGRWIKRSEPDLERDLMTLLEDAHKKSTRMDGSVVTTRFKPTPHKVSEVAAALKALGDVRFASLPQWDPSLGADPNPEECIGFVGSVVCVSGGKIHVVEDSGRWLDTAVMRVEYQPDAPCPRWIACVESWSCGDPVWATLLQRWMGYCLLPTRRYERWMLWQAPVRAGKGTIVTVLSAMMGDGAVLSKDFRAIRGEYGLAGLESARVMVVNEVKQCVGPEGEEVARVLKSLVGQDPLTINSGKWKPVIENALCKTACVLCSNEIPNLPNRAGGLSAKMLLLPFSRSFLGAEDPTLKESLVGEELPGIAAWCVEGARQVMELGHGAWVMTEEAQDRVRTYERMANLFQEFVQERFVQNPLGEVVRELVVAQWVDFLVKNRIRNVEIREKELLTRLEAETSWGLKRVKSKRADNRDRIALRGLSLRKKPNDHE